MRKAAFKCPANWRIESLPHLLFFQEGPGVRNWQFKENGVKLLNVGNINNGKLNLDSTSIYLSEEEAYGKYAHFLVDEGDLVIASSGIVVDNFHNKIAFVESKHLPLCMNTSTIRFKTLDRNVLDIQYFRVFLGTHLFKNQIKKLITGTAQLNFGPSHLKKISIPLPPIQEQIRIATLLSRVETLIATRKDNLRLLDEFLKATFLEMFGDPVRNEKGWKKIKIRDFSEVRIGPFGSLLHAEDYVSNGVPLVNPSHIVDGKIVPDSELTLSEEKYRELSSYHLWKNDVVVARRGEIGRCAIVTSHQKLFCGTGSMFIRMKNDYPPILLHFQIFKSSLRDYLESKAKGVTMKNLNSTVLGGLEVLNPPIELQNQFATIVEKTESLKTLYQQNLTELENLYAALSQKAFKGELDLSRVP